MFSNNKKADLTAKLGLLTGVGLGIAFALSFVPNVMAIDNPLFEQTSQETVQEFDFGDSLGGFYQGNPDQKYVIDANNPEAEVVPSTTRLTGNIQITGDAKKVSLSLRDADVKQVLRMFADKANMNIIFHKSAQGKVTLDLRDISVNSALEFVLDACELTYIKQDNNIIIASKNAAKDLSYTRQNFITLPVKYINAQYVADFLNENMFNGNYQGVSATPNVAVNANKNELMIFGTNEDEKLAKKILAKLDVKPMVNIYAVNHITPEEMANTLCDMLLSNGNNNSSSGSRSSSSRGSSGGSGEIVLGGGYVSCSIGDSNGSSRSSGRSGSGSISNYVSNPLTIAYFPEHGTVASYGGSKEQANMIKDFIKIHDKKQPMAFIEISLIQLNETASKTLGLAWRAWTPFGTFTFDSTGLSSSDIYFKGNGYAIGHYGPEGFEAEKLFTKSYSGWGPITATIDYLLKNTKSRTLTNPKILVTNGQESTVDMTEDYLASVTRNTLIASNASTSNTIETTYNIGSDLGIKVNITPFISPDGYVVMNLNPEYSVQKGSTDNYTLLSRRNIELKNVRVKDGETLVLAGMILETESNGNTKVPLLGELPVVGPMFRSSNNSREKTEVVILVTPHIVYSQEQIDALKQKHESL